MKNRGSFFLIPSALKKKKKKKLLSFVTCKKQLKTNYQGKEKAKKVLKKNDILEKKITI